MKRISACTLIAFVLFSCNSGDRKITVKDDDGTTTTISTSAGDMKDLAKDYEKKTEELKKLTPLSTDELKAFLPETLNGAPRKSFEVTNAMGVNTGNARYDLGDGKEVKLTVLDCAGEMGSAVYGLRFLAGSSMQSENDNEYTKSVEFRGGKAIENYNKTDNSSSLTWLEKDRLVVVLDGEKMDVDALKTAANELKF